MKKLTAFVLGIALVAGCSAKKGTAENEKGKLTLTAPGNTTLKQGGEKEMITVKVKRENFNEDVKIAFDKLPDGVTVEEKDPKVSKGSDEVKFTLQATNQAKIVDGHEVHVTASYKDLSVTEKFKVTVKAK